MQRCSQPVPLPPKKSPIVSFQINQQYLLTAGMSPSRSHPPERRESTRKVQSGSVATAAKQRNSPPASPMMALPPGVQTVSDFFSSPTAPSGASRSSIRFHSMAAKRDPLEILKGIYRERRGRPTAS